MKVLGRGWVCGKAVRVWVRKLPPFIRSIPKAYETVLKDLTLFERRYGGLACNEIEGEEVVVSFGYKEREWS